MSQLPDDSKAAFTIDLSGDGGTETAGQTFGRITGGIVLMILGAAIGLGSIALLIASIVVPSVQSWFDIITEFWWIIGGLGLGLIVFGFELVRRGRKRNRSAIENTFNTLASSGLIDAETTTDTSRRLRARRQPQPHAASGQRRSRGSRNATVSPSSIKTGPRRRSAGTVRFTANPPSPASDDPG